MEDAARRSAIKATNEAFLLDNLPRLHLLLDDLDALAPVCERLEKLRRAFRIQAPSLHRELLRMVRGHDGAIVVFRKRSGEAPSGFRSSLGGGKAEYEAVTVAHLRGGTFLTPSYNPVSELSKIRGSIEDITGGDDPDLSEDDVLDIVCGMGEQDLDWATKEFRLVQRHIARLAERLEDIATFLSDTNIDALDRWGGHDENEFKFHVERMERNITFRVRWDEQVTLHISDGLRSPKLRHLGFTPRSE